MFKSRVLKPAFFTISCIGTYAGAVNLGFSDIVMAIPFIFTVIIGGLHAPKSAYGIAALITLLISTPFYFLKREPTPLFYPMIGQEVVLSQDVCYYRIKQTAYSEEEKFILPKRTDNCEDHDIGVQEDIVEWKAGTSFVVKGTTVSSPDFSESYSLVLETEKGPVKASVRYDSKLFTDTEGNTVKESDLYRGIFYYPSQMMYWPIFPIMLTNLIPSF